MTSPSNDLDTKSYFVKHNFFDYPKDKIYFFKQGTLPVIDTQGKILLDGIGNIKEASNGNGDVFNAFKAYGLIDSLISQNIKWLSLSGIDNIILDIIDPLFLGITIANKSDVASKSIPKNDIESKEWVFAYVNNLPHIINPANLPYDMRISKDKKGFYNYNQLNILSHLFSFKAFISLVDAELPYHMAFRKNDYINEEGMKVVPSSPNAYKFEKFIFDSFKYFNNFTLLEVDGTKEFSPIKAFNGTATPENALKLYLNKINKN